MAPKDCDVAVVGAGAAGLFTAIKAAEAGASVVLVSRKPLSESSSYHAQGGLAASLSADDTTVRHAHDTFDAGRSLCRTSAVEVLTEESPAAVHELVERGVAFDTDADGSLQLGLEGGHSARRIVHAGGSQTGRVITSRLAELANANPRIDVLEGASAISLLSDGNRCGGAVTDVGEVHARATILATGGGAALWQRTTNPWGAIGAGLVLGHQAGAELADLELCQFHPTGLAVDGELDGTLITEAVRGEGATLLDASGRRFTDELAPRDQVSAAILDRMEADGTDHVRIDLRGLSRERFPNIFEACTRAGFDAGEEPVPVAPAAHYLIGGVVTDLEGRTSITGLYAVGECSCTGLHGANRLASNSLSECFVFGARAAAAAVNEPDRGPAPADPGWRFDPPTTDTRAAVWQHAGPQRSAEGLTTLLDDPYPLARLIAASALRREETRGVHRRSDFPLPRADLDRTHLIVGAGDELRTEIWP